MELLKPARGQFPAKHFRTDKALALGLLKAHAVRHALSPHLQASTQVCSAAHEVSAKQSVMAEVHFCSPHSHVDGQAVLLQSGGACPAGRWTS